MIRLDLVSGFLGAGKTTWLERLARADPTHYDHVLVNEVAHSGIDDTALKRAFPGRVTVLSGACICCDGSEVLRTTLHDLVTARHRRAVVGEQRVVLETSGISDPHAVLKLIEEDPVLGLNVRVGQVIVLVSAVGAHQELRHRLLAQRQVALADVVHVSRSDLVDAVECESVVAAIRALNADVAVRDARTGEMLRPGGPLTIAPVITSGSPGVCTWSTCLSPDTVWSEYAVWIYLMTQAHSGRLLRTKAILPAEQGAMLVQSVGGMVLPAVASNDAGGYRMACVLEGLNVLQVSRSFAVFVPSAGQDCQPS